MLILRTCIKCWETRETKKKECLFALPLYSQFQKNLIYVESKKQINARITIPKNKIHSLKLTLQWDKNNHLKMYLLLKMRFSHVMLVFNRVDPETPGRVRWVLGKLHAVKYLSSILLMVQKSQTTTWDVQNLVNNGKKYQPQLVSRISEPSTVGWALCGYLRPKPIWRRWECEFRPTTEKLMGNQSYQLKDQTPLPSI